MIKTNDLGMEKADQICKTKGLKITQRMTSNFISIFVALLTASGVGYGFYYTTKSQLHLHDQEIKSIKLDVKLINEKINENNTIHTLNSNEIKHLNENCKRIEKNQETIIKLLKK